MARIEPGFRVPPEVPRYFADKNLRPRFSWLDVWAEEHAHAFTVAKATELDLLRAFKTSIQKAIERGQGFETWREGLQPELQRLGWWGPRMVKDPEAKDAPRSVDFSRPRRLETIFWSNMRSARAAGQWERIQRSKQALPYLLYVRTASLEPRPEHLRWAGTILPADDPFWRTHFPPNGWGCKCSVRQIGTRERDQKLLDPRYSDEAPPLAPKPFRNRRTGEITLVPEGIDPGWQTNPGLSRAKTLVTMLQERLEEAGPVRAKSDIAELMTTPMPRVMMGLPERVRLPIAVSVQAQQVLQAASPIIVVSNQTMRAKAEKHDSVDLDAFTLAQDIIDKGVMVDEGRNDARSLFLEIKGIVWKLVLKKSAQGFLRVQTLFRTDRRKMRMKTGNVSQEGEK